MVPQSLTARRLALPLPALLLAAVMASIVVYAALTVSFFPTADGTLGHDYEYFLPVLLAGKYWVAQNGLLSVPRFSPAFCGGVPFLANPQSLFYSVPQALALVVDPVTSYRLTTLLFGAVGAIGTYLLMTRRFGVSTAAAALSAVIFLFNGFSMHRMAIGHVTYHVVGLIPLLCFVLLTPLPRDRAWVRPAVGAIAGAAAIIAYFVYAGATNMVVQLALTCLGVWLIHGLRRPQQHSFWLIGGAAGLLAAAVGAAKLAPAQAWLAEFPRTHAIELVDSLPLLLADLLRGLFFPATLPSVIGRHEWEFGVGLVPLFLLARGARVAMTRFDIKRTLASQSAARWARLAAFLLLMLLPIWLNYGDAAKAAWLKTLPYIGDNVVMMRWFSIYLLPLTIVAGCLLDFIFTQPRERLGAAIFGILVTVAQPVLTDRGYYQHQPYEPGAILAASRLATVPPVTAIGSAADTARNDALVSGMSSFPCYEPMFGYRLEIFPGTLAAGPLSASSHLRNPACYIYGDENGCTPGADFSDAPQSEEAAFADYRPFAYALPAWQVWSDRLSLLGLGVVLAALGFSFGDRFRRASR